MTFVVTLKGLRLASESRNPFRVAVIIDDRRYPGFQSKPWAEIRGRFQRLFFFTTAAMNLNFYRRLFPG